MSHLVVARPSDRFRLRSKRYRVGADGLLAVELVNDLLEAIERRQSLFRFRYRIRALRNSECRAVLAYLAGYTSDANTRLVAIWLRGQLSNSIGTEAIAALANDSQERIRVAVAKAMHRMSGWSVLSEMQQDLSSRVRRLAMPRERRSFSDCLGRYSDCVSVVETNPSKPMDLYVAPDCEFRGPTTLRTAEMIRSVLERIRELVATGRTWQP